MPLIFEINRECSETAMIVESYLRETVEETYYEGGKKRTRQAPRWTLAQVLSPSFSPSDPSPSRRTTSVNMNETISEDVDVSSME